MRTTRWLLMAALGVGLLGVGAGVTWGTRFGLAGAGTVESGTGVRAQEAMPPPEPWPVPAPREPSERERQAASIVETVKKTCAVLKQPGLTSYEVAAQLGRPYPRFTEELTSALFDSENPLLVDDSEEGEPSEVRAGNTPTAIVWVDLRVARDDLLTLADLERAFGPAYRFGDALYQVTFHWESSPEGPLHCRIRATVYSDDFPDHFDRETGTFSPALDRSQVFVESFHIDRGTLDEEGYLWMGLTQPPPRRPRDDSLPASEETQR